MFWYTIKTLISVTRTQRSLICIGVLSRPTAVPCTPEKHPNCLQCRLANPLCSILIQMWKQFKSQTNQVRKRINHKNDAVYSPRNKMHKTSATTQLCTASVNWILRSMFCKNESTYQPNQLPHNRVQTREMLYYGLQKQL